MMKLSEAILLGIGAVRNEPYQYLNMTGYNRIPGVCGCAIGTALYAVGRRERVKPQGQEITDIGDAYFREIERLWPWTKKDGIAAQVSVRHTMGESRESLAAWIAMIEPQNEPSTVETTKEEPQHIEAT